MTLRWRCGPVRAASLCALLLLLGPVASLSADELDRAIDDARHEIASWRLNPKQDLYTSSHLYVHGDGSLQDRRQAKQDFSSENIPFCMRRGQTYQLLRGKKRRPYVAIRTRGKGLVFKLGVNCVTFHVRLGHRPTAADLRPRALARYFEGFFHLEGAPETTALGKALAEMERQGVEETTPAPSASKDSVERLAVRAVPESVEPGGRVELRLDYQVRAGRTVAVRESWNLSFDGGDLPSFPTERVVERAAGRFTPAVPQTIPSGAQPGEYVFKGEVCVGEECISRVARFRVTAAEP